MILTEPIGTVSVIRLDRAAKRNALTPKMLASLVSAISTAASARAIVLSGVGDVFCAGFDLAASQNDDTVLPALLDQLSKACDALRQAPCPVVCSAHGAAIAGGCALASACDFLVTNDDAKLGYPAVKLGISPAVSAPHFTPLAGFGPARALMLDPRVISGRDALRLGLAAASLPAPGECEAHAIALATALAAKPRHALAYTKRWLNELDGSDDRARRDAALAASLAGVGSDEQRSLLQAAWKR
ncbi:MAG: hypothetical protein GC200_07160 [Tepidisphaera sp.]|nr:hypothetical protein [Tepidisphaera sp.]